ncbi:MAG: TlpA disulfide reductase family protein [Agriterribacter sp.]
MKFFSLFSILLVFGAMQTKQPPINKFVLKGTIKGKKDGYVYLLYWRDGRQILDSSVVKAEHFVFTGNIHEPARATFLAYPIGADYEGINACDFYIDPSIMQFTATINHLDEMTLSGSVTDMDRTKLIQLKRTIDSTLKPLNTVYDKYYKLRHTVTNDQQKKLIEHTLDSVGKEIDILDKQKRLVDSAFIVQHPHSFVAADILSHSDYERIAFPLQALENIYEKFPPTLKKTRPGQKIKAEIALEKKASLGSSAENFTSITNKGNTISLEDFKGKKYILLDFWASWCGPCRQMTPVLKDIYKEYSSTLEIIGIANQDSKDEWSKAVIADSMQWPQILENKNTPAIYPTQKLITDMYSISSIPSYILIDRNLKIIDKYGNGYYSKSTPQLSGDLKKLFQR